MAKSIADDAGGQFYVLDAVPPGQVFDFTIRRDRAIDFAFLGGHLQRRNGIPHFEESAFAAGAFGETGVVAFHVFATGENELRLSDGSKVAWFWSKFVVIDAGFDQTRDRDVFAADVLPNFGKDGGQRGNRDFFRCRQKRKSGEGKEDVKYFFINPIYN